MNVLRDFVFGNTKLHYMEVGFSEKQAEAMSWIAQQKAKGKFVGASTGLFLALSWGHWHHRILGYFRLRFNQRYTQLGIIMLSILTFDHIYTGRRKGANEVIANNILMNNNLFMANIDSIISNFDIMNRKFTPEQIEAFQYKRNLLKTRHHKIEEKKWIYNENIYDPESFAKRIDQATIAPWKHRDIRQKVGESGPVNIKKLVDSSGQKLGILQSFTFGWSPLH